MPGVRLIIGPTCAGKSSLLCRWQDAAAREDRKLPVYQSVRLRSVADIPTGADDLVHYNLLRGYGRGPAHWVGVDRSPLLGELVAAAEDVTVLTAPVGTLRQRAEARGLAVEQRSDGGRSYPKVWHRVLRSPVLAQVYEHLALHLDQSGTPHRYLCANGEVHQEYQPVSRWEFTRLAVSGSEKLCQEGHPAQAPGVRGRSYQGDYREDGTAASRAATLSVALRMPVARKRVLDVGCAEGAAALSAERMGAEVTAIEPRTRRFNQARAIAESLGSRIDFRNVSLTDVHDPSDSYDVVLALNVIHHVADPFAFLDRLAELTSSHLVLEYPGPNDRKFKATLGQDAAIDEDLPLVGVSTAAKGQTFVFAPASLERYLTDTTAVFDTHELRHSPIAGRWVSVFSGKATAAPTHTTRETPRPRQKQQSGAEQLRKLEQTLHDMRRSRSWRVTAPLRKIRARLR